MAIRGHLNPLCDERNAGLSSPVLPHQIIIQTWRVGMIKLGDDVETEI
ncbi:MAG: hypothetical protein ACTSRP_12430 [Candidatus Helarchaeota archaeon]